MINFSPPVWFNDVQAKPIVQLLVWFIQHSKNSNDSLSPRLLRRKLNAKNIPALFNYNAPEDIDFLWELILQLALPPYECWQHHQMRDLRQCTPTQEVTLVFKPAAEMFCVSG